MSVPLRSDDPASIFMQRHSEKYNVVGNCFIWTEGKNGNGYGRVSINGKMMYTHRLVYMYYYGPIPAGRKVDHSCYNHACINPLHLRLATQQQNVANRSGLDNHNTSGIRGVSWHKRRNKWQARIQVNGIAKTLGYFSDKDKAAEVVTKAREEAFGEFAGKG